MKIKLAILGACMSRETFSSTNISDYKDIYEIVSTSWQSSIISLVSNPIKITEIEKENFKKQINNLYSQSNFFKDLTKKNIKDLFESNPDYILVDLYSDIRYGVVRIGDNYLTNNPNTFRKTSFFKEEKFDETFSTLAEKKLYIDLLLKSFDHFVRLMKEYLPQCKLILVGFNYARYSINEHGNIKPYDEKRFYYLDHDNEILNSLYDTLITQYDIDMIKLNTKVYLGDANHIYGKTPWHFTKDYHLDFYSNLNSIILKDLLNNADCNIRLDK